MRQVAGDGYVNYAGNYGKTGRNIASGGNYQRTLLSLDWQKLNTMYRGNYLYRRVCDYRAEAMTKAGIRIDSKVDPTAIAEAMELQTELAMWAQIANCIRWSMLYGTSFIYPDIDGQDPESPLKIDSVGGGQLNGFMVFDRWQIMPSWQDGRILTLGPENGFPIYYHTINNAMGIPSMRIHNSRLYRIDAQPIPWYERYSQNFNSVSIVEVIEDQVDGFMQASSAAIALIERASNDIVYSDRLAKVAGENQSLFSRMFSRIQAIQWFRSNQGMTWLGTDEKMERLSAAMEGVAAIIDRLERQVSTALDEPRCLLFGESSGGLNGGDGDIIQAHNERTNMRQVNLLQRMVKDFTIMSFRSLGVAATKKDVSIKFNPLSTPSSTERAEVSSKNTATILSAYTTGVISAQTALLELKQMTEETGMWSNITDDDVEQADDEPPDFGELGMEMDGSGRNKLTEVDGKGSGGDGLKSGDRAPDFDWNGILAKTNADCEIRGGLNTLET